MSELLKDYPAVVEIPIQWGHMDAMKHVNNTEYFRYFESARILYFGKMNVIKLLEETGIGPILASTNCVFKVPLSFPDRVLVGAKASEIREDGFTMKYLIVSDISKKVVAEGDGEIVYFNYKERRKANMPEKVVRRIKRIENIK